MSNKNDDFYDNYDDKSGKGILMVIIKGKGVPSSINPINDMIKNSKLSDDFVPSGKTKEEILDNYEQFIK